jgi:hypothetical protein
MGLKLKPRWDPVRLQYGEELHGLRFETIE